MQDNTKFACACFFVKRLIIIEYCLCWMGYSIVRLVHMTLTHVAEVQIFLPQQLF